MSSEGKKKQAEKDLQDEAMAEEHESVAKSSRGVGKKEKKEKVEVKSSNTPEEVLEWLEKGVQLTFSHKDFLELPDSVVRELPHETKREYYVARGMSVDFKPSGDSDSHHERRKRAWEAERMDMIGGNAEARIRQMEREANIRKGYVARWLTPYDYRSWGEQEGYSPVKTKDGSKIYIGPEDAPEQFLCEVPKERIDRHRKARSNTSRERVGKAKGDLETRTEELNRAANATKESAMKVVNYGD